jgi:arginyl-tRNA synthetase
MPDFAGVLTREAFDRQLAFEPFWQLLLSAMKLDKALASALSSGEPGHMAKYGFTLAQAFNAFYHDYPILKEEEPEKRVFLMWLADYFRRQLEGTLDVLGIQAPEYM